MSSICSCHLIPHLRFSGEVCILSTGMRWNIATQVHGPQLSKWKRPFVKSSAYAVRCDNDLAFRFDFRLMQKAPLRCSSITNGC
jgi:hypothetical protein